MGLKILKHWGAPLLSVGRSVSMETSEYHWKKALCSRNFGPDYNLYLNQISISMVIPFEFAFTIRYKMPT